MSNIESTQSTGAGGPLDFPPGPPCMCGHCSGFTSKYTLPDPPCDICKHKGLWHRDIESSSSSENTTKSGDSDLPGCTLCPCDSFAFTLPIDYNDDDPKCGKCEHRISVHTRQKHHPGDQGEQGGGSDQGQGGRKCNLCSCTHFTGPRYITGQMDPTCTNSSCHHKLHEHAR